MFSVLFEVNPRPEQWDSYLEHAKMLKPELEQITGFVDNIRYRSLIRDGWILSLSGWSDEKAVVRWRTKMRHHDTQQEGRSSILQDYHLRVGQITRDNRIPAGQELREQRLDETEIGEATTVSLVDMQQPAEWVRITPVEEIVRWLGAKTDANGLVAWDLFDAVLTPGDFILMLSWRSNADADTAESGWSLRDGARSRRVRVVRDYGMYDRREAPQYYPDVSRSADVRDLPVTSPATPSPKS